MKKASGRKAGKEDNMATSGRGTLQIQAEVHRTEEPSQVGTETGQSSLRNNDGNLRPRHQNAGIPPRRYGIDSDSIHSIPSERIDGTGRQNKKATGNKSSSSRSSEKRKRLLAAERRANESLLEIERRQTERERELVRKNLELEKAEIEEDFLSNSSQDLSEYASVLQDRSLDVLSESKDEDYLPNNDDTGTSVSKGSDRLADAIVKAIDVVERRRPVQHYGDLGVSKRLPTFSGDPEQWLTFYTQYKLSEESGRFTKADLILRLQEALQGKAREAVETLMVTPDNLELILEILERNFGRPDLIIRSMVARVRSMTSFSEDRFDLMMDFSNKVHGLVNTMKHLRSEGHMTNPQLLADLSAKLPATLRLQWGAEVAKKRNSTLEDFATWMNGRAAAASFVDNTRVAAKPKVITGGGRDKFRSYGKKSKESVMTVSAKNGRRAECFDCKEKHFLVDCKTFRGRDVGTRWVIVRENKLCFGCLKGRHFKADCSLKSPCPVEGCSRWHHELLHEFSESDVQGGSEEFVPFIKKGEDTGVRILLKIVPVVIQGPKSSMVVNALLDDASTVTLIDAGTARSLGMKGKRDRLTLRWTDSSTQKNIDSETVSLGIRGLDSRDKTRVCYARTVEDLSIPSQAFSLSEVRRKWPHLKNVRFNPVDSERPKILIGQDNASLIVSREVVEGSENVPMASRTHLGWVLHGRSGVGSSREDYTFHVSHVEDRMQEIVEDSYKTESLGVRLTALQETKEEIRAREILDKTAKLVDKRWQVGLLWREEDPSLPDSYNTALVRLRTLERSLGRDRQLAKEYSLKIQEYLDKGYARQVTGQRDRNETGKVWYLPHFGVVNANKTERKLRLVFDAAAKTEGRSLNDHLLTGPDMLSSLQGVLFKFRQWRIGFVGDIKEMFHRIEIRPEDRCAQRFLWRDLDSTREPRIYEMTAMIFGASSSPFTAQYIKNKNADRFQDQEPEAVRAIKEKHYVDDYLDSCNSETEAINRISTVIEIHGSGGFSVRNWAVNSEEVLRHIDEELRSREQRQLPSGSEKVLGITWIPETDRLSFACSIDRISDIAEQTDWPTKREVLRIVASIFDPLGLLSIFTVRAKILLQDIWRSKIGWDDQIPTSLRSRWVHWVQQLARVRDYSIPRCYASESEKEDDRQLHVFSDASEKAFACVAYLRTETRRGVRVALVAARSRVSPLKTLSIPRLELQAALMASRLSKTIEDQHEIKFSSTVIWTDSKTVLHWIRGY